MTALHTADRIAIGSTLADRVYAGEHLVWGWPPDTVGAWSARHYDPVTDELPNLISGSPVGGARLGSMVGADTGDPTRPGWLGSPSVWFPGEAGNLVSTPGSDVDLTGSYELVGRSQRGLVSSPGIIIGKHSSSANGAAYLFAGSNSVGVLQWQGGVSQTVSTTALTGAPGPGQVGWWRARRTAATGAVEISWAPDGPTEPTVWTVAATLTGYTGALDAGPTSITSGARQGGAGALLRGHVLEAIARESHGGPDRRRLLATDADPSTATWVSSTTGETWTVRRPATGLKAAVVDRPVLLLDGVDDYLRVADDDLLDFADGESATVVVVVRLWGGPPATTALLAKRASVAVAAAEAGWLLRLATSAAVHWVVDDGAAFAAPIRPTTMGVLTTVAGVRAGGQATLSATGTAPATVADPTGSTRNDWALFVGRTASGSTNYASLEYFGHAVARRHLTAHEIDHLAARLLEA